MGVQKQICGVKKSLATANVSEHGFRICNTKNEVEFKCMFIALFFAFLRKSDHEWEKFNKPEEICKQGARGNTGRLCFGEDIKAQTQAF